jgi:hypothetical protein
LLRFLTRRCRFTSEWKDSTEHWHHVLDQGTGGRRMRDDLHALARRRERSASAEMRIALRNHLSQPPPEQARQREEQDSTTA